MCKTEGVSEEGGFIIKLHLYNGLQSDVQELSAIGVSRGAENDKWLHWMKFMQVVCSIKLTPIHLFINSLCFKSRFVTGFEIRSPVLILRDESAKMVQRNHGLLLLLMHIRECAMETEFPDVNWEQSFQKSREAEALC